MASSSSWFTRSPSRKRDYELPRWHASSAMSASIIPPPIVQSTYKSSPKLSTVLPTRSVIIERPAASESQESELQADLQFLLDAQAEGLIRGLEAGSADDGSSAGSSTPTAGTSRGIPRQVNRPVRKKLGLRSARKGIYNCMVALSSVKDDELESATRSLKEKKSVLDKFDAWESKKLGLQEAASSVDNDEETVRVQRIRREADEMQEEINKVELHLMELKSKHRRLMRQATAVENAVQAKLASYTTSLNLLENDIKRFLSTKPEDNHATSRTGDLNQSVWQLPHDRRTLDMAREHTKAEQVDIQAHLDAIKVERDALDEGSKMWMVVIGQVTDLERRLRSEMVSLGGSMTDSTTAWDDTPQISATERLNELNRHIQTIISHLEHQMHLAEERNWRLLIAAIGAELDALRRGQQILNGLVGHESLATPASKVDSGQTNGDQIHALDNDFQSMEARSNVRGHDTDEEPDPELLFSVQDADIDD